MNMNQKRALAVGGLTLVFGASLVLGGEIVDRPTQATAPTVVYAEDKAEAVELADWEGEWDSITIFLDDDKVKDSYAKVAERDGVTEEEAKKAVEKDLHTKFDALEITDKEIIYFEKDGDDKKEVARGKYTFKESVEMEHGGAKYYWHIFETDADVGEYKQMALMDIHGEEAMAHYHLRYAEENIEKVLDDSGEYGEWYPTMVNPDVHISQVIEEIEE